MQVSAEIRWFWRDAPPPGLKDWFCRSGEDYPAAGGGKTRVDEYFHDPDQVEVGLKRRGNRNGIEIKSLVARLWDGLDVHPFTGPVEIWTKCTSPSLVLPADALIRTEKQRWLRKFDTGAREPEIPLDSEENPLNGRSLPAPGCNVELTQVTLSDGAVWWTLCFEASGTLPTIESDLRAAAKILSTRRPPSLGAAFRASYPTWLAAISNEQ